MILAIIQARMGSSRLPGKVLRDIMGKPLLEHVVDRLKKAAKIDRLVVATTVAAIDDPVEEFCRKQGFLCFRGSEEDVLDRYYQAALCYGARGGDAIARMTGDCPLIDPEVADRVIGLYLTEESDYVSNVDPPTFPDGLDVEVFSFSTLKRAWLEAHMMSEREHVTLFIRNNPAKFKLKNLQHSEDLSKLRWTVDQEEDLRFVRSVYERLYNHRNSFFMKDVLKLLQEYPELSMLNEGIGRNEGLLKSLVNDFPLESS